MNLSQINPFVTALLPLLTLVGMAVVLALVILMLIPKMQPALRLIGRYSLWAGFTVAASAIVGSLFYSDVAGYAPCILCWYQRILIYPQAIILGIAAWRRDFDIRIYAIAMSAIGAVISIYHYWLQFGGPSLLAPCSTSAVSCSSQQFAAFGFITIPLMCLVAFMMIIALMATGIIADRRDY